MDPAWTFQRGDERLRLQRHGSNTGYELMVIGQGEPRTYAFPDLGTVEKFQADMESFLLKTGWSFEHFSPERRTGTDRRTFPRVDVDRRRWWTDGLRLFGFLNGVGKRAADK